MVVYPGKMHLLALAFTLAASGCAYASTTPPSITDWITAILTFVLAVVGATQAYIYWKQKGVMENALRATQESNQVANHSAEAAMKAANTTLAIERARIAVEPAPAPQILDDGKARGMVAGIRISFSVKNHGRTEAFITDDRAEVRVLPADRVPESLPEPAWYLGGGRQPRALLDDQLTFRRDIAITADEFEALMSRNAGLVLYGSVLFEDVFGDERPHGFAWTYTVKDEASVRLSQIPEPLLPHALLRLLSDHEWELRPGPRSYFAQNR